MRKDFPYLDYDEFDFDVPVGQHGDVYDRYLVRLEEMLQSVRILEQALDRLRRGPINVADPRLILPPQARGDERDGGMIHHFKQVMEGVASAGRRGLRRGREPEGREGLLHGVRRDVEAGAVAHPSAVVRQPVRDPALCEGALLSDVIAINASIDIVMGEIDR